MKDIKFIKKFGSIEPGTVLEYSNEDNAYIFEKQEETTADSETNSACMWSGSSIAMTPEYAEILKEKGIVEEVSNKKPFVNVFDEIETLRSKVVENLNKIKTSDTHDPLYPKMSMDIYANHQMLDMLNYLKSLRK